jgi:hypothetical protein
MMGHTNAEPAVKPENEHGFLCQPLSQQCSIHLVEVCVSSIKINLGVITNVRTFSVKLT